MNDKGVTVMPIIDVKNVTKQFGKGDAAARVLDGLSFSVEKGEFVSLMGASGSGKSTMLYLIGGLDRDFGGRIELCGEDISAMKEKQLSKLRLEKIGFIFQFYNLVQNLSVADNIMLPLNVRGKRCAELKDRLDEILELTGLSDKRKAMPSQLSGGQQQRVAIARAIMGEPELILADEPTGNLDTHMTTEIMQLFSKINKEKSITVLQVTHSSECASYGSRTVFLEDGHVVERL